MQQPDAENNALRSLKACCLFEGEVLVWLLLEHWNHPMSSDGDFRSNLLETAAEVLSAASEEGCTQEFISGMPANDMNLISALWYVESFAVGEDTNQISAKEREKRNRWLDNVRRSLPSCFCPQDALPNDEY